MATAYTRERDSKRDAKAAKAKADKEEKNRQQQAKVVEEFNAKKASADGSSDAVQKIKAWCQKPPYLDLTNEVKVSRTPPTGSKCSECSPVSRWVGLEEHVHRDHDQSGCLEQGLAGDAALQHARHQGGCRAPQIHHCRWQPIRRKRHS